MGININIKEFIGDKYSVEDAILVREIVENNLDKGIVLDFKGLERVQSTFLTSIFSNLINKLKNVDRHILYHLENIPSFPLLGSINEITGIG